MWRRENCSSHIVSFLPNCSQNPCVVAMACNFYLEPVWLRAVWRLQQSDCKLSPHSAPTWLHCPGHAQFITTPFRGVSMSQHRACFVETLMTSRISANYQNKLCVQLCFSQSLLSLDWIFCGWHWSFQWNVEWEFHMWDYKWHSCAYRADSTIHTFQKIHFHYGLSI